MSAYQFVATRNALVLDDDGQALEIRPHLFNAAFPRMIVERVQPGDTVWVDGVHPQWSHDVPVTGCHASRPPAVR